MQWAWPELVRIAGIRGQSCFHQFGLTTIIEFDPVCVALVSVIGVTGLSVSITDIALAGSNYLIFQLHFSSVTFFAQVRQMVHKFGSHWWGRIRDILPAVQRNNNSDVSLHNVLTRIFSRRDDPGSNPGTLTFVVNKNNPFIFILGLCQTLCCVLAISQFCWDLRRDTKQLRKRQLRELKKSPTSDA